MGGDDGEWAGGWMDGQTVMLSVACCISDFNDGWVEMVGVGVGDGWTDCDAIGCPLHICLP